MLEDFAADLVRAKEEWELDLRNQIHQLQELHNQALVENEEKHQTAQNEIIASYKKQIEELRNFYSFSMLQAKKEAETQRLADITNLKHSHDNHIIVLTTNYQAELLLQKKQLTEQKDLEISELTDDNDKAMQDIKKEMDKLTVDAQNALQQEQEVRNSLEEALQRNDQMTHEAHKKENYLKKKIRDYEMKMVTLKSDLETTLKLEKENLQIGHIHEMQVVINEFEKVKNCLKKEISNQSRLYCSLIRLDEAAEKYINREPRQIDLDVINNLNLQLTALHKKQAELNVSFVNEAELKTYRLEMRNREESFNKIFNNSPLVGIMQPSINVIRTH